MRAVEHVGEGVGARRGEVERALVEGVVPASDVHGGRTGRGERGARGQGPSAAEEDGKGDGVGRVLEEHGGEGAALGEGKDAWGG